MYTIGLNPSGKFSEPLHPKATMPTLEQKDGNFHYHGGINSISVQNLLITISDLPSQITSLKLPGTIILINCFLIIMKDR